MPPEDKEEKIDATVPTSHPNMPEAGVYAGEVGLVLSVVVLGGVTGLCVVSFLGHTLRAPPAFVTACVTFLPYLYLGALLLISSVWIAIPDRKFVPIALLILIASGGVLWGPMWPAQGEEVAGESVTVLSWNLRRMWGGKQDGSDPKSCVVQTIKQHDPDVLSLMEVSERDVAFLEEALGLKCIHSTYRQVDSAMRGGLASCVYGKEWDLKRGSAQRFVDDEDWFYVFSEMERSGHVFNLLTVHLYPYEFSTTHLRRGINRLAQGDPASIRALQESGEEVVKAQSDQSAALLDRVQRFQDPTIVAGDFNSTRDSFLHGALRDTLIDTWEPSICYLAQEKTT